MEPGRYDGTGEWEKGLPARFFFCLAPFVMSDEPLEQASEWIRSEFDLVPIPAGLDSPELAVTALRQTLSARIAQMLLHEFERLLAVLYRVDVGEEKAQAALRERDLSVAADRLAELIIARQIEKAESRRRRREKS